MICTFGDCGRPAAQQGLCSGHLSQQRRGTPLRPLGKRRAPGEARSCSFEGCERAYSAKGYCRVHYYQLRRDGHVYEIIPRDRPSPPCVAEGCSRPSMARGWCASHYRTRYEIFERYSISPERFAEMLFAQSGRCDICGDPMPQPNIDHDHSCCDREGSCGDCVRGLLCRGCNHGIGMLRDSVTILRAAVAYLEHPPSGAAGQ